MLRSFLDALFRHFLLGDIEHGADQPLRAAIEADVGDGPRNHPAVAPVAMQDSVLRLHHALGVDNECL